MSVAIRRASLRMSVELSSTVGDDLAIMGFNRPSLRISADRPPRKRLRRGARPTLRCLRMQNV
jgi:hypothetical protein